MTKKYNRLKKGISNYNSPKIEAGSANANIGVQNLIRPADELAEIQKLLQVLAKDLESAQDFDQKALATLKSDILAISSEVKPDIKHQHHNLLSIIATTFSGAASLGLLTAVIAPSMPLLTAVGAVVGMVGSYFAGNKIDQMQSNNH